MQKLSSVAWQQNQEVYNDILKHPFTQGLMTGNLNRECFQYYILQDIIYLKHYARVLSLIASKLENNNFSKQFQEFSLATYDAESNVHKYYVDKFKIKPSENLTQANIGYTSYLYKTAYNQALEVAVASILPCFWIYNEVAKTFAITKTSDTYKHWIDSYATEKFSNSVNEAIHIFDKLATYASQKTQNEMLEAYSTSCYYEWHFFNDCYKLNSFKHTKN